MLRAFLLIGGWLKSIGIDPAGVKISIRFPSMRERFIAGAELKMAAQPASEAWLRTEEGFEGSIFGIPVAFTDPTYDNPDHWPAATVKQTNVMLENYSLLTGNPVVVPPALYDAARRAGVNMTHVRPMRMIPLR